MGGLKASLSMALWKPHVAGVHWQSGGPSAPQAGTPVWGGAAALEWVSVPVAKAKAELGSDPSSGLPHPLPPFCSHGPFLAQGLRVSL